MMLLQNFPKLIHFHAPTGQKDPAIPICTKNGRMLAEIAFSQRKRQRFAQRVFGMLRTIEDDCHVEKKPKPMINGLFS
jgi:hypothetical protein